MLVDLLTTEVPLWTALKEAIEEKKEIEMRNLSNSQESVEIFRLQGKIRMSNEIITFVESICKNWRNKE